MYALIVSTDYEGSDFLGVYSSVEIAVEHAERIIAEEEFWGDVIEVFRYEVDADPRCSALSVNALWTHRR